ncbi:hypothetical protein J2Y55_001103 [Bosea sp. BE125]|uniref:hypothetical protein n=1 Tax=Bosea sp. BE125 TaxID=2817909 RepID=UPI002860595E|nr:hypothetical protein [Bosea sp. BE125]MDR6870103.1 hypothetical protein [Bosea sp. BE125]
MSGRKIGFSYLISIINLDVRTSLMKALVSAAAFFILSALQVSAQPAPAATCGGTTGNDSARILLSKTLNRPAGGTGSPLLANSIAEISGLTSPERPLASIVTGSEIAIRVKRPSSLDIANWNQAYTFGAAETERRVDPTSKEAAKETAIFTTLRERSGDDLVVRLNAPGAARSFFWDDWSIVIVICSGNDDKILAYTNTKITVWPAKTVIIISLAALLIFWSAISFAAWQLNAQKLEQLWQKHCEKKKFKDYLAARRYIWKAWQASNPIFIAQDSLGYGSLARVQILFFTTVVGVVLFYIFIHSGELTSVSNTILILLGIMVAGGTFARATPDWYGLSSATRRVLLGEGLIVKQLEKPRFSDLLETQGEIDVAKVQALMFTVIVAMSIVAKGYGGLNAFELPEQFIYLLGISQSAYVLGKFVPTDVKQRIEQDFEQLRQAADKLLMDPANQQLINAFSQAKNSASYTLKEVFLDRFQESKLATMGSDRFSELKPAAAPSGTP